MYVNGAQAGTWTVTVRGYNVASGPQPFALVVDGGSPSTPPTPTPTPVVPTPTPTATATPAPGVVIHMGDLDGSASGRSNRWTASVTVLVRDSNEAPVAGIGVAGTWGGVTNGGGSCTTGADGTCSVSKSNIRSTGTATFSVTALSGSSVTYNAGANHDPDGDSNGTTIGVANP